MKTGVINALILTALIVVCAFTENSSAATKVKAGILFFDVHSEADMKALEKSVPVMIADHLEKDGAETELLLSEPKGSLSSLGELKATGLKYGVDYLIWGSIFSIGGKISIDTKVFNVLKSDAPVSLYGEAGGIENLFSAVTKISKEMASEIFNRQIVVKLMVEGNKRIESDAILRAIDVNEGDVFNSGILSKSIKDLFKMGYFEDIRIDKETSESGVTLIYRVSEKPSVRRIKYVGNNVYEDEDIAEVVQTGTGSILNIFTLNEDVARIKKLYTEKNYHNCDIGYKTENLENNQADVTFTVSEGKKLKIEEMTFTGNKFFSDKEIKKVIKTNEKGFFSWLTSSGDLDKNEIDQDVLRIDALYKNNGFIDSRVAEPVVKYEKDHIKVTFKIQEGEQFKTGNIDFKGDMIIPEDQMLQKIKHHDENYYSRELLRSNVISLTDIYAEKGYANADVSPSIRKNTENNTVDITFIIDQGDPVYFERIIISGNTKTRDKVIRRQIAVYEQELYSMSGIQRSVKNLQRIDYFENVDVKTSKGSREDTVNLNVEIAEKATGAFSFGGGYSSEDSLFGMVSATERNLFGKGQILSARVEVSGSSNKFTISFTEPWLFDIPLSAGFDLYNWDKEYDYYDKDSKGIAVRAGYRIFDYTTLGVKYGFEDFTIENVQEEDTTVDPGTYVTSSITTTLRYDSRNRAFNPTEGSEHSISVEYAGDWLGGEIDFTRYIVETGWYYPLFWKFTGFLHARAGFLDDRSDSDIDIDYERFYLGGMNSVRGYDWQDINAKPEDEKEERGGEKFVQFNAEIIFPLLEEVNLVGVVFYDTGDAYRKDEDIVIEDLYSSFGGGFRWYSPMGPIRIEYGKILNGNEYSGGRWEFSMGAAF